MGTPRRLVAPIVLCLLALHSTLAEAQGPSFKIEPITKIAAADTGLIEGKVTDEIGKALLYNERVTW